MAAEEEEEGGLGFGVARMWPQAVKAKSIDKGFVPLMRIRQVDDQLASYCKSNEKRLARLGSVSAVRYRFTRSRQRKPKARGDRGAGQESGEGAKRTTEIMKNEKTQHAAGFCRKQNVVRCTGNKGYNIYEKHVMRFCLPKI
jgi:hypothetical protein